jgi:hypothetical protein
LPPASKNQSGGLPPQQVADFVELLAVTRADFVKFLGRRRALQESFDPAEILEYPDHPEEEEKKGYSD